MKQLKTPKCDPSRKIIRKFVSDNLFFRTQDKFSGACNPIEEFWYLITENNEANSSKN